MQYILKKLSFASFPLTLIAKVSGYVADEKVRALIISCGIDNYKT